MVAIASVNCIAANKSTKQKAREKDKRERRERQTSGFKRGF